MKNTYTGNFFALFLLITMLIYKTVIGPLLSTLPFNPFILSIFAELFIYSIPLIVYFISTKASVKDTLSLKPLSLTNIFIIAALSFFLQPLLMLISAASTFVFPNTTSSALESYASQPFWVLVLSVSVMPAIFEELLFRGLVFSNYRNVPLKKAALAVGFLFAMAHMDGQQFFYAFFMGIVFCYFVYKTGSIFASIASHFTINFSQSSFAYFVFKNQDVTAAVGETAIAAKDLLSVLYLVGLTLPVVLLLIYTFNKTNKKHFAIETEEAVDYTAHSNNDKVFNAPLLVFIIIFAYFLIAPLL